MTGYARVDSVNNIADGNIINASDLDGEFDGVAAAFNSSTGHIHDGSAANGAPITKVGPTQDVVVSATTMLPKTTATVDIGSSGLKFKDFFFSGAGSVTGTITAGGFAGPINGTIGATTASTGAFTTLSASSTTTLSGLTASTALALDASKNVVSVTNTGTGSNVLATSPTLVTPALGTPSALVGTNITGTATSFNINGTVGATTPAAGAFTTLTASSTLTVTGAGSIQGLTVGRGGGAVATNTAVGASALAANTTGTNNTAFGASALASETGGNSAIAIGYQALLAQNVGTGTAGNVAIGDRALTAVTTGFNNIGIGLQAGFALTTGTYNIAIGRSAMQSSTLASTMNIAIGFNALNAAGECSFNVAVGGRALRSNTTGTLNTAIGSASSTGTNGTLGSNSSGSYNTALGAEALALNTTASQNTAVGYQSLYGNTTGTGNTAMGYQAALGVTTGSAVTAIGYQAAKASTTANNIVAVGYNVLSLNTANDIVGVGISVLNANTTGTQNIGIGYVTLNANTTGNYNTAVGVTALRFNTTGSNNIAIGQDALQANTTASNNTAVGYLAGYSNTTGGNNVAIGGSDGAGNSALKTNTTGGQNTAVGNGALGLNTTASNSTAVGYQSLRSNTTGAENSAFGQGALENNTTGNYNVAVGKSALALNTTASNNTAVGYQAGYTNVTGTSNTFLGYQAGYSTTNASNTHLGFQAGYAATTGTNNLTAGSFAGYSLTTGTGNTFVGGSFNFGSGYYVTTGSKNTILGSYNGNQGGLDIRTASNYIVLSDGDGNPRQVIDGSGNVGIGTTTPRAKFEVNGVGSFADGTAAAPTITFGNELTVGLFRANNATLAFTTGSAERMRIDSSGNLGIGTSSPTSKLHLSSSASTAQTITSVGANAYSSIAFLNTTTGYGYDIGFGGSTSVAPNSFYIYGGSSTSVKMVVDSSGNVGIGTTSPSVKLEVAGAAKLTNGNLSVAPSTATQAAVTICTNTGGSFFAGLDNSTGSTFGAGNYSAVLYNGANTPLVMFTNATERMRIESSGNVGIGTTSPSQKFVVSQAGGANIIMAENSTASIQTYMQSSNTNGVIGTLTNHYLTLLTNNTERVRIDSSGNVGIGNTPTAKLDVTSGDGTATANAFFVRGATGVFALYPYYDATLGCLINSFNSAISAYKPMTFQASSFAFNPNGTERMRIDSSGNVGIGTSSPSVKLQVEGATSSNPEIRCLDGTVNSQWYAGSDGTCVFGTYSNHPLVFRTNGAEKMRIDTSGNVGIGTTSSGSKLAVVQTLQGNAVDTGAELLMTTSTAASDRLNINFSMTGVQNRARAAIGAVALDSSGGYNLGLAFYTRNANNGTELQITDERMRIDSSGNVGIGTTSPTSKLQVGTGAATSTVQAQFLGGVTVFENAGATSAVPTITFNNDLDTGINNPSANTLAFHTGGSERMRIDSSGNLNIGNSGNFGGKISVAFDPASEFGAFFSPSSATNTKGYLGFNNSSGNQVGSVTTNGTITIYNTSSDYRLKIVVGAVTGHGARIDALEPIEYEWKETGTRTRGFLAHKFQEVYADSVTGAKDAVDANGKPVYQQMQASTAEVIADLVAEIQSLRKRLTALESTQP